MLKRCFVSHTGPHGINLATKKKKTTSQPFEDRTAC